MFCDYRALFTSPLLITGTPRGRVAYAMLSGIGKLPSAVCVRVSMLSRSLFDENNFIPAREQLLTVEFRLRERKKDKDGKSSSLLS